MNASPTSAEDDRSETPVQRSDRNWNELMQELRVAQTGAQILTGFLLTLAFQQRFNELDSYQRSVYLVLVALALVAAIFIVAPVSVHRILFGLGLKQELVQAADVLSRIGLAALALVLAGVALLLFDIVVGRTAGLVAGGVAAVTLAIVWLVVPLRIARGHR